LTSATTHGYATQAEQTGRFLLRCGHQLGARRVEGNVQDLLKETKKRVFGVRNCRQPGGTFDHWTTISADGGPVVEGPSWLSTGTTHTHATKAEHTGRFLLRCGHQLGARRVEGDVQDLLKETAYIYTQIHINK